jgi:hypothetical protein
MNITVRGDSVAYWSCAHMLRKAGFRPVLERTGRPRLPAIMLSDAAVALMRDVFECPDLFLTAPRISRRVVQWGRNAEPLTLEHSAVVVSEQGLLSELAQGLEQVAEPATGEADIMIFASRPLPREPVEHCFGSRIASAAKVSLKDARDSASCWIESLEEGWLFLIPNAPESGWLLSVGGSPQSILKRSRLIAGRIAVLSDPTGEFSASPRIMSPLCGPGWLACGTAAMAFDPLCGDGTAHAVREAILASAVVRAISNGGDAEELRSHYESRLTAGFQRHLATCRGYYLSGGEGPWWQEELKALHQGLEWCAGRLSEYGGFRYQLSGFELKAVI